MQLIRLHQRTDNEEPRHIDNVNLGDHYKSNRDFFMWYWKALASNLKFSLAHDGVVLTTLWQEEE